MLSACNAPIVALMHACALAFAFLYMNSGGLEWTERKIRRKIRAIDYRWRQKFKWVVESTGNKLVDCCEWFKSWLKCRELWASCAQGDLECQRTYSRRNQLKKSLLR